MTPGIKQRLLHKPWITLLLLVIIGGTGTQVIAQQPKQTKLSIFPSLTTMLHCWPMSATAKHE